MFKTLFKYSFVIAIVLFAFACKDKSSGYRPNVAGKAGELLVIMDDKIKQSSGGQELKNILQETYLGLPQEEPHFKISIAPHRSFSSFMKTFRNLVVTKISPSVKKDTILFYNDVWARPQALVRINAKDTMALRHLINRNGLKMLSFFNKAERERNISSYKKYPSDGLVKIVKERFGVRMNIPGSLSNKKANDTFVWMNEDADWGFQGVFMYEFPYVGEGTFSKEYLLNKRDSVLHRSVPGPSEGSYMTTEHNFQVIYKKATINDVDVVEIRGLWKVQGDMMGGPFIIHAHHDKKNKRVVVTDGYVYSPKKPDKRDKVRQMEALMYTFNFME